jgi:hypothetical protein
VAFSRGFSGVQTRRMSGSALSRLLESDVRFERSWLSPARHLDAFSKTTILTKHYRKELYEGAIEKVILYGMTRS